MTLNCTVCGMELQLDIDESDGALWAQCCDVLVEVKVTRIADEVNE